MDCRRALDQAGMDLEAAVALLREWGMDEVSKRAERATKEGRIALAVGPGGVGMAELACETDFVARNELFVAAAQAMADAALERRLVAPDEALEEAAAGLGLRMKENIVARRVAHMASRPGELLDVYLHGDGTIGAAVRVAAEDPAVFGREELKVGVHDLCLQVAAKAPRYIDSDDVPAEDLREAEASFRAEIEADPKLSGKPQALLAQILAGKLRRHLSETCLYGQRFVKDESIEVGAFVELLGKKAETRLRVTGFLRLAIEEGEGGRE